MQRQGFPEVLVNIATVQVPYPNANAEQVERDIIIPIESAISDIENITDYSMTAADNFGFGVVTFDQKADVSAAVAKLKQEVLGIQFPEDSLDANVEEISASGVGEFVLSISEVGDEQKLFEAGLALEQELSSIDGVKRITPMNPILPELHIVFDEELLIDHDLARQDIEGMISTANFVAPAGSFIENGRQINVLFQNKVESIDDIQNLEINDELVLSDVASVEVKFNNQDQYNRIGYAQDESETLDIERALLFGVQIKSDADILVISDYLEELVEGYEEGKLTIVYSQAESTRLQIEEITQSIFGKPIDTLGPFAFIGYLLGGLGFVTLLLFFFMNIRVAIMAALAIPASLFSAAIYLNFVGIDLNTLVLFAMVLVIGLVVDPTIVFLESMQRYIEEGKNGKEAAVKTVETVGLGVFLAVLTNILVFVPFGLVSGFFGEIIKYIPATVIPAMIASMLIPIVFLMPLSAKIMKPRKKTIESNDELAATWKL